MCLSWVGSGKVTLSACPCLCQVCFQSILSSDRHLPLQFSMCDIQYFHILTRYASIPVPEMCSDYYRSDWMREAYRGEINPLPHAQYWVVPDQVRNLIVHPWKVRLLPGRPKKSRYRSCVEKAKQIKCSKCGTKGHNKRSCKKPSSHAGKKTKTPRSCGVCHKQGHNRQTCQDRPSTDLTSEDSAGTDTGTNSDSDKDWKTFLNGQNHRSGESPLQSFVNVVFAFHLFV